MDRDLRFNRYRSNKQTRDDDEARMTTDEISSTAPMTNAQFGALLLSFALRHSSFVIRHLFGVRDDVELRGPSAFRKRDSGLCPPDGVTTANRSAGTASTK